MDYFGPRYYVERETDGGWVRNRFGGGPHESKEAALWAAKHTSYAWGQEHLRIVVERIVAVVGVSR